MILLPLVQLVKDQENNQNVYPLPCLTSKTSDELQSKENQQSTQEEYYERVTVLMVSSALRWRMPLMK